MKAFRILICCTALSYFSVQLLAQPSPYDPLPKLIPQTPEAAAIQRFGETEINLFKGEPSISVPLYTLAAKGMSVPVFLSYNAGGFRVAELSTCVGLGWNLNYGGMISQNVRGRNDLTVTRRSTPNIRTFSPVKAAYGDNNPDYDLAVDILHDNLDTEPDIFHYNFLGRSGKFMFNDSLNRIYTIPHEKLEIQYDTDPMRYTIRDENGILYYFAAGEGTGVTQQCELGFVNPREVMNTLSMNWYLTKIKHPLGDSIVFSYESYAMKYREGISETRYKYLPASPCAPYTGAFNNKEYVCTRIMGVSGERIKKIIAGGVGEIEFYYVNTRQDVDHYTINDAKSLDSIVIRNSNRKLNKFVFTYSYFAPSNIASIATEDQPLYRRLKLERITDESSGDYIFKYNSKLLPNRLSNSQDRLGYANGQATSGSMIPCGFGYDNCTYRNVNINFLEACVLQEMTYPTGGKTKFFYEPHRSQKIDIVYDTTFRRHGLVAQTEEVIVDSFYLPESTYDHLQLDWNLPHFPDRLDGVSRGSVTKPDGTVVQLDQIAEKGSMIWPYVPGHYRIIINNFRQYFTTARIDFTSIDTIVISQEVNSTWHSGLRVKEILDSAGFNSGEVRRQFSYADPISGLDKFGDLRRGAFVENITTRHCESTTGELFYCNYARYTGHSVSPYGIEYDNQFGYPHVRIYYDTAVNGGRGYEQYRFATMYDEMDSIGEYQQFAYFGKLLQKDSYRYDTDQHNFSLLQRETNRYAFLVDENDFWNPNTPPRFTSGNENFIPSMKLQYLYPEIQTCNLELNFIPAVFQVESYVHSSFSEHHNKSETALYATDATLIKTTQVSYFDNPKHDLPTRTISVASNGDTIINAFRYMDDYSFTTSNDPIVKGLINLNAKHVLANPIEKITYLKKLNGDLFVVNGILTTYKPNIQIQDSFFVLEMGQPIPANQFIASYVDGNGNFVRDPRYKIRAIIGKYDAVGNIVEQQRAFDAKSSYIWDYSSFYPIAECRNADSVNIAHTSFEADGSGNWTIASASRTNDGITGTMSYPLSGGSISKNDLTASTEYIVTYWTTSLDPLSVTGSQGNAVLGRTVGDWRCYMHRVTGVTGTTISGSGLIDELRLHPKGAQMATYTFEPLIGITSQCDVANKILYYEYDSFGRLKVIRDQDKNILKKYDYGYQWPAHNDPILVATGNTRCKPCNFNSNYTTNILQNEVKDTNPNSEVYNQIWWEDAGASTNCIVASWENTATAVRCKKNGANENTGEQEQEQKDMNPCSPTFNQTRWVVTGTNYTSCPLPYVYAKIILSNPAGPSSDVIVAFYADQAGTIPIAVNNLVVAWQEEVHNDFTQTSTYSDFSTTCNGQSQVLLSGTLLTAPGPMHATIYRFYYLLPGTGYLEAF